MPITLSSFKKTCKALSIEGVSIAAAFISDYMIISNTTDSIAEESTRVAMNLRVYYLTKNILYALDSLLTSQDNHWRAVYSGAFNLGVAASTYPANRAFAKFAVRPTDMLCAQSIIYASGATLRLLTEKKLAHHSVKQYLSANSGKLFGGAMGIFFSLIPSAGMSSPALCIGQVNYMMYTK